MRNLVIIVAFTCFALWLASCASKSPGGPTSAQSAALVTCSGEAAAVNILADLRTAGKLSPAIVTVVNKDIALVDPVCSAAAPNFTLAGVAATAAAELVTLAGGQ